MTPVHVLDIITFTLQVLSSMGTYFDGNGFELF